MDPQSHQEKRDVQAEEEQPEHSRRGGSCRLERKGGFRKSDGRGGPSCAVRSGRMRPGIFIPCQDRHVCGSPLSGIRQSVSPNWRTFLPDSAFALLESRRDVFDGATHHGRLVAHHRRGPHDHRDPLLPVPLHRCAAPGRRTDPHRRGRRSGHKTAIPPVSGVRTEPAIRAVCSNAARGWAAETTGR